MASDASRSAHIQARITGLSGAAALRTALIEALPIDQERLMGARVQLAFWGRAVGDPTDIAEQRGSYEICRTTVQDLVKDAHAAGEMPGYDNPEVCADVLVAVIDGLRSRRSRSPPQCLAQPNGRVDGSPDRRSDVVGHPRGLHGGHPGAVGHNTLLRADGTTVELPSRDTWQLHRGDRIRIETPVGGWGIPVTTRSPRE